MSQPKAVVFDVGNILIRWDAANLLRGFFASDAAYGAFLAETRILWTNLDLDAGEPFTASIEALAARFPHYAEPILAFDRRWEECVSGVVEDNVATLKALKAVGAPVHAITNFSRAKFDFALPRYPFLGLFDHALVSADVGLVKPDYRIYHRFCRDTGLKPGEIIFVDDSALNIAAAKAVGFHTFHMPHADAAECAAFRELLRGYGFQV